MAFSTWLETPLFPCKENVWKPVPGAGAGVCGSGKARPRAYPLWGVCGLAGLPLAGSSAENCYLYSPPHSSVVQEPKTHPRKPIERIAKL